MLYLLFQLGDDRYALDVSQVVEVLPLVRIRKMLMFVIQIITMVTQCLRPWKSTVVIYMERMVSIVEFTVKQTRLGRNSCSMAGNRLSAK